MEEEKRTKHIQYEQIHCAALNTEWKSLHMYFWLFCRERPTYSVCICISISISHFYATWDYNDFCLFSLLHHSFFSQEKNDTARATTSEKEEENK